MADEAHFHGDEDFIQTIQTIEGFHAKAMWSFLEYPQYQAGDTSILFAENIADSS